MEAALKTVLTNSFGEYVKGLDRVDVAFPLVLNNLQLKEKEIQEAIEENGNFPFDISDGTIGQITIKPGWMGSIEVCATNVVLNMSFSAVKAMRRAMRKEPEEEVEEPEFEQPGFAMQAPQPQVPVPPRFCLNHDASEKRVKGDPMEKECQGCHVRLQTSYAEFTFCPNCSEQRRCCMICGQSAPKAGNYVPVAQLPPPGPAAQAPGPAAQAPDGAAGNLSRDLPPPPPPPLQGGQRSAGSRDRGSRGEGAVPAPPAPPAPPLRQSYGEPPYRSPGQALPPSPQQPRAPAGAATATAPPAGLHGCGAWPPGDAGGLGPGYLRGPGSPMAGGDSTSGVFGIKSLDDVHKSLVRMLDFNSWGGTCNAAEMHARGGGGHVGNLSGRAGFAY